MSIQILVFLLFFQAWLGVQPAAEKTPPIASGLVMQSLDGGQSWQDVSAGLPHDLQVRSIFSGSGELFLSSEKGLYQSNCDRMFPNWEKAGFPDMRVDGLFSGLAGPYVYFREKGLYQKLSGSGLWVHRHSVAKGEMAFAVLDIPGGGLLLGTGSGIFKTDDSGKEWKRVIKEGGFSCLVDAGGALVAGGARGLLRSTDQGLGWTWTLTGEGEVFKIVPVRDGIAAIARGGENTSRLLFSGDKGKTWKRMDKGLPSGRIIFDIEQGGGYLFCSLDTGIYRSQDQGKTWELVLPAKGDMQFELAVAGHTVFAVTVPAFVDGC